jgi:hypothetical protein
VEWALTQFGFETYGDVERDTLGEFNIEPPKSEG